MIGLVRMESEPLSPVRRLVLKMALYILTVPDNALPVGRDRSRILVGREASGGDEYLAGAVYESRGEPPRKDFRF